MVRPFFITTVVKKEVGEYRNGEKHGKWIKWNESGNKVTEANYYLGDKEGEWTIWDAEGNKRYEMFYDKGEKVGTWKMWNEEQELVSEREY